MHTHEHTYGTDAAHESKLATLHQVKRVCVFVHVCVCVCVYVRVCLQDTAQALSSHQDALAKEMANNLGVQLSARPSAGMTGHTHTHTQHIHTHTQHTHTHTHNADPNNPSMLAAWMFFFQPCIETVRQ